MIEQLLDELAEIRAQIDVLRLDRQEEIDSVLTPEIKAQLDDIDTEFDAMSEAAMKNASELEVEIKRLVIEGGESVKGQRMKASFVKGRITWDSKALDGYMVSQPALAAFRKEGKPSVRITIVK